jgi:hypothetical protein
MVTSTAWYVSIRRFRTYMHSMHFTARRRTRDLRTTFACILVRICLETMSSISVHHCSDQSRQVRPEVILCSSRPLWFGPTLCCAVQMSSSLRNMIDLRPLRCPGLVSPHTFCRIMDMHPNVEELRPTPIFRITACSIVQTMVFR